MKERNILLGLILSFTLLLGLGVEVKISEAQSQSISISPPIIEVQTVPPSSPTVPILIQNNNSEDVKLMIELIPFKQADNAGNILLDPEYSKGFYPYYKDKIQFLINDKKTNVVELQALETKKITLNINLDKGDPAGDYYYSIIFISQGTSIDGTSLSKIPAGIATNLLLSIGPKETATGGISEFTTSRLKSNGPVEYNLKVHNAGKNLILPTGDVEISNMFGQKVGKVEILPQYILAGADRYLVDQNQATNEAKLYNKSLSNPTVLWSENFLLGLYKSTVKIKLEDNGKIIEATTYFVAFPIYLFFAFVILIFISLSIYLKVKKRI